MSGIKKLATAGLMVLGVRLALLCGAGVAVGDWLKEASADGRLVSASLTLELGPRADTDDGTLSADELLQEDGAVSSPAATAAAEASAESETPLDAEIIETTIYSGLAIKTAPTLSSTPLN